MQIVVGLLCDSHGDPLSIEVFPGNTGDASTFFSQVKKLAHRFGAESVTLVGDRGMIKAPQIAALSEHDFHYITAITKPQIESLIVRGAFQYSFFDEDLSEVTYETALFSICVEWRGGRDLNPRPPT
ncbi:MAG: transposase [Deltaproteobacteria bacterium]|nr:transposase [Deltaproteobacteria bacterium]